jgi:3-methyladenine DNA glycosylase AlkD
VSETGDVILAELRSMANPANVSGMARYGINPKRALGIKIPALRNIARQVGKNQSVAIELWQSEIHEARILASFIAEPALTSAELMETWVMDFDSWDVCDQVCSNLFDRTPFAIQKSIDWSGREDTFVRRAAFVLMAALAVHQKNLPDEQFESFFPLILQYASDERNYVKKSVNWALRQIGKRNQRLNRLAIAAAQELMNSDSGSARWVAGDALRELSSEKIQLRFVTLNQ